VLLGHTVALPKGEEARKESRVLHFTLYEDGGAVEMTAYAGILFCLVLSCPFFFLLSEKEKKNLVLSCPVLGDSVAMPRSPIAVERGVR